AKCHAGCSGNAFRLHIKHAGLSVAFGAHIAKWLPKEAHSGVGKETGQTSHVERHEQHLPPIKRHIYSENFVIFQNSLFS
ncbi:hypothetical protein, partial [Candidatus Electronema sp. JM]|uniref:hypothetical protein n=1 Tax=Candidatus Electronema sp. JM TaxID=3401571 RepID=UPI003AA9CDAD